MRILHLVSYPLYSGPLPPTLGLAKAQQRLGHTVWLAFDSKRGAFNDYEEAAAPHLNDAGLEPPVTFTLSTKSSPRQYLRDLRTLRRFVRSGDVDIVHLHMSHDHGLAALAGAGRVKRVRTFHAERSLVRRFGQALLTRRADAWVVRCRAHRKMLLAAYSVPEDRTRVVEGSIDGDRFSPASDSARIAARERFDLPNDVPALGHVALIAGRGQEELIDAAAQLGDEAPYLVFVGRGENEEAVRERAKGAGLEARFTGYLDGDDLLVAYAALDAAFVAQPGNDASSRAALEAMACGLPVIAVQTGALAELVDDEVGYPVLSRAPNEMAMATRVWLGDLAGGRVRGRLARERVLSARSFAREAETTLELYETVLRG